MFAEEEAPTKLGRRHGQSREKKEKKEKNRVVFSLTSKTQHIRTLRRRKKKKEEAIFHLGSSRSPFYRAIFVVPHFTPSAVFRPFVAPQLHQVLCVQLEKKHSRSTCLLFCSTHLFTGSSSYFPSCFLLLAPKNRSL